MNQLKIWQDKIVLYTKDPIHSSLIPYCKFNDKFRGYLLTFSQQNLKRIYDCLGAIPINGSRAPIELLKNQLVAFKAMQDKAMVLKNASNYPQFDLKEKSLGDYQTRGAAILFTVPRVPLFADCGVGKTWMVLVSTEQQIKDGILPSGKTLILGKLSTLETGWLEDCQKFTDLKAVLLWLPPSTTKRKEKMLKLLEEPADIYVANHDTAFVLEEELTAKQFQKVVVDESTILKSYHGDFTKKGGKFGKALMRISKHATWRVVMSGTPAPNGPEDLWGQFKFLDPEGFLLEPNYFDFKQRFMDFITFGSKAEIKKWYCKESSKPIIKALIDPLIYRVKIREHIHDLPERTIMRRRVRMSPEQQDHYENMLEGLSSIIDDKFISVDIKLAQLMKLRQITGGFLIDQEEVAHEIPTATKLEAMDDLLEEIGDEKVVIYAQYQWEIASLAIRYKDRGVVTVYGGNKPEVNLRNIKSFIHDNDIRLIILHPRSAAHGITLTVSHYMIFYSSSYSAEENYQCIARIERASQRHPMFIYYLLAKECYPLPKDVDTIDEIIYRVVQAKQLAQSALIEQPKLNTEIISAFT